MYRRRITVYLRHVAPDQTRDLDDATLNAMTGRYMNEARLYGVRSEAGMGRWAYLQVLTGGRMLEVREVRQCFDKSGHDPDATLREILSSAAAEMRVRSQ